MEEGMPLIYHESSKPVEDILDDLLPKLAIATEYHGEVKALDPDGEIAVMELIDPDKTFVAVLDAIQETVEVILTEGECTGEHLLYMKGGDLFEYQPGPWELRIDALYDKIPPPTPSL